MCAWGPGFSPKHHTHKHTQAQRNKIGSHFPCKPNKDPGPCGVIPSLAFHMAPHYSSRLFRPPVPALPACAYSVSSNCKTFPSLQVQVPTFECLTWLCPACQMPLHFACLPLDWHLISSITCTFFFCQLAVWGIPPMPQVYLPWYMCWISCCSMASTSQMEMCKHLTISTLWIQTLKPSESLS